MKAWFSLLFFVLLFASCDKSSNNVVLNASNLCLDTATLQTAIPEPLETVFFINETIGFVAGSNGGIYKTTDAGNSWTSQNKIVNLPVYSLYFLNEQTGFAVGGVNDCAGTGCIVPGGFILKTTDGGNTWKNVYTPANKTEVRSVYFVNASTGFCVGVNTVYKTTDGGQNWSEYTFDNLHGNMMQVQFANVQEGYIACLSNQVAKTIDGGQTWQLVQPHQNNDSSGFYTLSLVGGSIYLAGQTTILKSTDKGNSWNEFSHSPKDIFAIHFIDDKKGFVFGRGNYSGGDFGIVHGSLYCTENGGNTWNGSADVPNTGIIKAVSFPSNQVGYAVCGYNVIKLVIE